MEYSAPMDHRDRGGRERINAQFSSFPATECIGAGRLDGWFVTPAYICDQRGWGHISSYCFEGELFFHLQRSPLLRGINFQKKEPVTFEVVEVNGKCEAVKLLTPTQKESMDADWKAAEEEGKPQPTEMIGQRVQGIVKSQNQLVTKQKWGFAASDAFAGQVFWHITENPEMQDIEYEREDLVEFDVCMDQERGGQVRARNMRYLAPREKPVYAPTKHMSESKMLKRQKWKENWRKGPPPDWVCKNCGFKNFGRNRSCIKCADGLRPPREEWPAEEEDPTPKVEPRVVMPPTSELEILEDLAQPDPPQQSWADQSWQDQSWPGDPQQQQQQQLVPYQQQQQPQQRQQQQPVQLQQQQQQYAAQNVQNQDWSASAQCQKASRPSPFGQFPSDGSVEAKLALCMGAFTDMMQAHQAGTPVNKVHALVQEVNEVLGQDRNAKHAFAIQLAKHPWFGQNGYEVRFQPSKNLVSCVAVVGGGTGEGPNKRPRVGY